MYTFNTPFVVVLLGTAGVGKSTLAEFLKNQISNTAHVSIDHIKRYMSEFRDVPSHIQVSRNVTDAMIAEYLKNGISVVVDQGMDTEEVQRISTIANQRSAQFLVYRIEAAPTIRLLRLKERAERVHQPVMSEETMDILFKIYTENDYPGTATFDSGLLTTEEIANLILKDLQK